MSFRPALRRTLTALHLTALYSLWHKLREWDPRRLRHQSRFRRWNRDAPPGEIVLRPGLRLAIDPRSREPFEHFCFRSIEMTQELDAFLRAIGSHRRFLDVGACHGVFALAFAQGRPQAAALALDPSPVACEVMAANVRANRLDNITVRQVAAGPTPGRLRMRRVWHHLEAIGDGEESGGLAGEIVEIPVETLDGLCGELGFRPDLVKIDVEGYELAVLQGARGLLNRDHPRIFLELHPQRLRELGDSAAAVVGFLNGLGYRFEGLNGAPLANAAVARREAVSRVVCVAG